MYSESKSVRTVLHIEGKTFRRDIIAIAQKTPCTVFFSAFFSFHISIQILTFYSRIYRG